MPSMVLTKRRQALRKPKGRRCLSMKILCQMWPCSCYYNKLSSNPLEIWVNQFRVESFLRLKMRREKWKMSDSTFDALPGHNRNLLNEMYGLSNVIMPCKKYSKTLIIIICVALWLLMDARSWRMTG